MMWVITIILLLLFFAAGFIIGFVAGLDSEKMKDNE